MSARPDPRPPRTAEEVRVAVQELLSRGLSDHQAAHQLGLAPSDLRRLVNVRRQAHA